MITQIVNVVVTASVNQTIDLSELGNIKNLRYNPDVYGGHVAYFKDKNMQGRVSIFASGKMISVGTNSEQQAFDELDKTVNYLVDIGFIKPVKLNPKVRNLVVTANFGASINLEGLALASNIIYEPEQFPAAILHLQEPIKASVLIFTSGKTVLAGLKGSKQIEPTVKALQHFIETHQ
ncbi:MAG: hypothetical protein ACOWW1_05550 [archaeon]